MKNPSRLLSTAWAVLVLLVAAGCSHPVLDYRNAEVSDGLIYASGANEPFTGMVTHVPDSFMINGEGHAKFMKEVGGDKYAVIQLLQVVLGRGGPASLCTISVRKGYVDGAATCFRPQSDTRMVEAHFDAGQLSGKLVYYNPQKPDQKLAEGSFNNGQPDGQQKIYSVSTGELMSKVTWSNGLYDGNYARYSETTGKVTLKGTFSQGRRAGKWEEFTADGKQLVSRWSYKDGNPDGVEEQFDAETGARRLLVDQWRDGKISGTRKRWDKNGVLVGDETFTDGVLIEHKDVGSKSGSTSDPVPQRLLAQLAEPVSVASAPRSGATETSSASQSPADLDTCVNEWMAAHRKVVGEYAMIAADQLDEWREWCTQGKRAPN